MIISYRFNYWFILFSILFFFNHNVKSQIQIFERPTNPEIKDISLFFESETRKRINLNGQWEISFNEGKSFEKYIVPLATTFSGVSIFKKKFDIPEELISSYSFIFVAEGINYESEVKINGNFISSHTGGYTPIIIPVSDGTVLTRNEIIVSINSKLNFKNTVPLSDQINYSKVYGGIIKDIYLVAVPKLFIFRNILSYNISNLLSLKAVNQIEIRSSNLFSYIDTAQNKSFYIETKIIRKSSGETAGESSKNPFTIGDNNTIKTSSEIVINNPVIWTPENPELYVVKTIIKNSDEKVIDESNCETGFTNLTKSGNQIFSSGKPVKLNGINYYEDLPRFASALEYTEVEKDLKNIKTLGFNSIRVPGRCAHPYIVNLCNRLGLYLFQEIPFNELSNHYIENEKYIRLSLNSLADIIERDRNSPCIFAWGIGNDFDVSSNSSLEYVKSAAVLIDSTDKRFKYYTSRAGNDDICSEQVDFTGINFYETSYEELKNSITSTVSKSKPASGRKNPSIFVSAYGISIENNNTNGFSDERSLEAQMKFISECYPKISQTSFGNFISSYADWNSENPLNYRLDPNPFLKTNGLYTLDREKKRTADYVKRILNNEDLPRLQEGNFVADFPYVFIVIGMITIIILIYFLNRDRKFRSGMLRCLYKPTYFYTLVKDQMIISTGYNLLLALSISIGLAIFFSSIIFFYRENNSFDMILAKIFTNDSAKLVFSEIVNNKFYLIGSLTVLNLLLMVFTAFFLYFISFYTKGKSFFKNIYTVCVWSTLPMLLFLFIGTIIYKLSENNPGYIKTSLWIFGIIYLLYLNRIILGTKSLFDIRTGKVYLYGLILIFFIFAIIYSYFFFFTGALETMDLISNLTKN